MVYQNYTVKVLGVLLLVAVSIGGTQHVMKQNDAPAVGLSFRKISDASPRLNIRKLTSEPVVGTFTSDEIEMLMLPGDEDVNGVSDVEIAATAKSPAKAAVKNSITIPRMGVNTEILEGKTVATLNKGIWHLPGTSDPTKGGNMVIAAHRYKWLPPSTKTFWDIDKMKPGDEITVVWQGKKIVYRVTKTSIVTPDRVDILKNTKEHKLTLFSCTPKYTTKFRLVVEATPVAVRTAAIDK